VALLGQGELHADERALGCGREREWRDNVIELTELSTGFDKLQYGTMLVSTPRLVLDKPVRWLRDPRNRHSAARCRSMPGKPRSPAAACCRHRC
jgi:hypothetical protein